MIECYTDGAYSPSLNSGGIGIVFVINGKKVYEYNRKIPNSTNNKCELLAVIIALKAISKPIDSFIIYSDSQYVINSINNNWKRKKNIKYWNKFDEVFNDAKSLCKNIQFKWVKGHSNCEYNNLADKLAVEASNYE